jgi:Icc-related predicted phosphoesterase
VLGLTAALVLSFALLGRPPTLPWAQQAAASVDPAGPILIVGDTQRTSWPERSFFLREQNEAARRALVEKMARDEHPAFVVHVGDLVTAGADPAEWEYFDRLVSPLTVRRVRIEPVLGNHDYWGCDALALKQAARRFPELASRTFRSMRHHGLALVLLDSNLDGEPARMQARWFEDELHALQQDPTIRGVLVFTHHPPFTNGEHREGDPYVRSELLPLFLRSTKAVIFVSGHVHGYERFTIDGKTYVVTGGGGGPRVEYRIGRDADPAPAYATASGARRAFNYVVIDDAGSELRFTVKCLQLDARCEGGVLERFTVSLPTPKLEPAIDH